MNSVFQVRHAAPADLSAVMPVDYQSGTNLDDWYGSMMNMGRTGDWYGSMMGMGGLKEAIASMFAGQELDDLRSGLSKIQDRMIDAYNALPELEKAAAENADLLKRPDLYLQVPFVGSVPTPAAIEALKAKQSVDQGYRSITGLDYMVNLMTTIFTANLDKMRDAFSAIDSVLVVFNNFDKTWQERVGTIPGMNNLWDQIQNRHNALYASAGGKAVASARYDDPLYLQSARQAVEEVTGVQIPDSAGMSGLGQVETTLAIIALIKVLLFVIAIIAVVASLVMLAKQFNVGANNAYQMRVDYEKRMADQRTDYINRRTAEGASVADAQKEWEAIKARGDEAEKKKEDDVAARGPGSELTKILTYGGIVVGGAIALPHILKAVGLGDILGIGEFLGVV
jgi:hypothetical protein